MTSRAEKAVQLHKSGAVQKVVDQDGREIWTVMGSKLYTVQRDERTGMLGCDCPDYLFRRTACKHVKAAELAGANDGVLVMRLTDFN